MRKTKIVMVVVSFILMLSASTLAFAGYYSIGVGGGGEDGGKNLSLEIGSKDIKFKSRRYLAGIGILAVDHGDENIPPDTIASPCPHNDFTSLGKKSDGIESGLLGKIGVELFRSKVYISILEGIAFGHEIHLTQSNPTGEFYEQSKDRKLYGVHGISVGYFPDLLDWKLKLNFQIDYDNRRGVTGYIGWGW